MLFVKNLRPLHSNTLTTKMKTLAIVLYCSVTGIFSSIATEKESTITEIELKSLDYPLPTSIRLRADMAALQHADFVKSVKELGFNDNIMNDASANPSNSVSVYKAWDGVVYLRDDRHMALWVRANNEWKCLVAGLRVDKTMGGAPPTLPLRYMGGGFFAITETVPGDVAEKSERGFPQALAVTFLIDSNNDKVMERSETFVYDHNPPVKVPEAWMGRYKLKNIPATSPKVDKPSN